MNLDSAGLEARVLEQREREEISPSSSPHLNDAEAFHMMFRRRTTLTFAVLAIGALLIGLTLHLMRRRVRR